MSRNRKLYDDDDLDDGYDDDDWYEEEEEWAEEEAPEKPPAPDAAEAKKTAAPAAAASASVLARSLCDPPPALPSGKQQKAKQLPQAQELRQQAYPIAPAGPPGFRFDQPSPDDVILAAQGRADAPGAAPGTKPYRPPLGGPAPKPQQPAAPAAGLQALSLGQQQQQQQERAAPAAVSPAPAPAPAARPLSEYSVDSDLRSACDAAAAAEAGSAGGSGGGGSALPRLHLVVLGHVDAGKSTLMGRLLYELGLVSEKTVHKTQRDAAAAGKASFAWAWMLDERPEERARGVTVDVAMSRFETRARSVTLLDAPGHRDFVPNMIAGAAQADAALLIVDGSPGGFEAGFDPPAGVGSGYAGSGGQTREHAQLARSLGVEQLAVVVTKLDTCAFSQERFDSIREQLLPFLKTCGFKETAVRWLPAVGPSGENMVRPPADARLASWWRGPTLAGTIDGFAPAHRLLDRPLRLPVADVQKLSSKGGVIVGGKLEGGALRPGAKVLIVPSGQLATVKSIEVDGKPAALARAGDGADVALTGVDTSAVAAGSVLCHPDFPAPLAAKFEARIVVLEVAVPVLRGQQLTLHCHAARESGHVSALVSLLNPKTGEVQRARPRCLLKGQTAVVEVTPARAVPLEEYSAYRSLGRVVLRDGGRTIAVGIVTGVTTVAEEAAAAAAAAAAQQQQQQGS